MRWLALAIAGCGSEPPGRGTIPYETLSEYGFFEGRMADVAPADGVVPYEVAASLWADRLDKDRFLVLPEGETAAFDAAGDWTWPAGTIVIKHFSFEGRAIETRLLILEDLGWAAHVYLWDDAERQARRLVEGADVTVGDGQRYLVPNVNQCGGCHERDDAMHLLGPLTRQMNREVTRDGDVIGQLGWLAAQGVLGSDPTADGLPALADPFGDAEVELRARSYLDANCSHCHREGGGGGRSGLTLLASETDPVSYGVCKPPVAAGAGAGGRSHDIVPGLPDESIVTYRMASTDPEIKMPELPNLLSDAAGVALIEEWIAGMTPQGCP